MSKWTHFYDMHSGGETKEPPYGHIYIEAPEEEAVIIFYNRFGHNPHRVTCTCCGNDYSISESESLAQATGHQRGCRALETPRNENGRYGYQTLDEYRKNTYVLFIYDKDIKPEERTGEVPEQGYIWQD